MTTRERILMATLELASEKGLGAVSLSQIAKKVGIQKPSLYNHFASKDEIIEELYEHLRIQAREKVDQKSLDYSEFVKGKSPCEILHQAVNSYIIMNRDPDMNQFYRFIMSERSIKKEAAKIMVAETEKMILATKQLFDAMQVQKKMRFDNIEIAAFSFAMAVHAIMDYMEDQHMAEIGGTAEKNLEAYILEFCNVYGNKCVEL